MDASPTWMFFLPTALMILFCVAAIVYIAAQSSQHGRSKRYAITAMAIVLLSQIVFPLLMNFLINQYFGPNNAIIVSALLSILVSLLMMLSLALLIIAVFIDRAPPDLSHWDAGGTPLADQPNENPYAAPRQ